VSIFKVSFTAGISLEYTLADTEIVELWKTLIITRTKDDLCKINHYVGNATESACIAKITRLYELADIINELATDRVIKVEINHTTWQKALHGMHVHFPELRANAQCSSVWPCLTEYNDIIHWLEASLPRIWGNHRVESDHSSFRITFDFNKVPNIVLLPVPESAYESCDPFLWFGQLALHYTHVGKHTMELFTNNDLICPKDQYVPQRRFASSVRLGFTDNFHLSEIDRAEMIERWKLFYEARGGKDFWEYDIDDPAIAFGYINIGRLTKISVDGAVVQLPLSIPDMNSFRKRLSSTAVIDWVIE